MALQPWGIVERGSLEAEGGAIVFPTQPATKFIDPEVGQLTLDDRLHPTLSGGTVKNAIDSFEDSDITEWTEDFDKADFGFTSTGNGVVDGTVALEGGTNGGTARIYADDPALPNLPVAPGDEFGLWVSSNTGTGTTKARQVFGFGDGSQTALASADGYQIEFDFEEDDLIFNRMDAGTATELDSDAAAGLSANTAFLCRVTWDDGTLGGVNGDFTVELYESTAPEDGGSAIATLTANDTTHGGGGIAIQTDLDPGVLTTIDFIHTLEGGGVLDQTQTVDVGALSITGNDPTVAHGGFALSGDVGALSVSGNDPAVAPSSWSLSADVGQATVTGNDPTVAGGAEATTIDSFEDGDLAEWQGTLVDFGTAAYGAVDGSLALDTSEATAHIFAENADLPGLPVAQGDDYRVWFTLDTVSATENMNYFFWFCWISGNEPPSSGYNVSIISDLDDVDIRRRVNDTPTTLGNATYTPTADVPTLVRVIWDDGTLGGSAGDITVEIYENTAPEDGGTPEVTVGPVNDTTFTQGNGIALGADQQVAGSTSGVDYIHKFG